MHPKAVAHRWYQTKPGLGCHSHLPHVLKHAITAALLLLLLMLLLLLLRAASNTWNDAAISRSCHTVAYWRSQLPKAPPTVHASWRFKKANSHRNCSSTHGVTSRCKGTSTWRLLGCWRRLLTAGAMLCCC
jgi:hypothetical protein